MSVYKICPVCKKERCFDIEKHVVQKARFEVWQKALGSKKETPHFDYYIKNTKENNNTLYARKWNK